MSESLAKQVEAAIEEAGKKEFDFAYEGPSSEPLEWDGKGVIRLDVAMAAIRVAAARGAGRSMAALMEMRLRDMAKKQALNIAKFAAARFFGKTFVLKIVLYGLNLFAEVWSESVFLKQVEKSLRRGILQTQRLLNSKCRLTPSSGTGQTRTTRRVASRHA